MHRIPVALLPALIALAIFASVATASAPEATTGEAIRISGTTVTLTGTVDTGGKDTYYGFGWGTTEGEYEDNTQSPPLPASESPVPVQQMITGLEPETTYYFTLGAINGNGWAEGEEDSFTTTEVYAPRFELDEYSAHMFGYYNDQKEVEDLSATVLYVAGAPVVCGTALLFAYQTEASASLSFNGVYGECKFEGIEATVKTNSCRFVHELGPEGAPVYGGSVGIKCSKEGDAITVKIPALGNCTFKLGAQEEPVGSVSYTNEGFGTASQVYTQIDSEFTYTKENPGKNFICGLMSTAGKLGEEVWLGAESVGAYVVGDDVS